MTKKYDQYLLNVNDLRHILFWAAYGVKISCGGAYQKTIIPTIRNHAKNIKLIVETKNDPLVFKDLTE